VPSYDANFALLIVMGQDRYETLDRLLTILDHALHIQGNVALQTNLQPLVGLLTFMRALPPATAFRTDTSLLWTGLTALVEAQKQPALSLLPGVPRQAKPYDAASVARLLRATLEASFAHPSRLLAYYLPRLRQPQARPLAPLEVLWQLATACKVPQFAEEQALGVALQQAADALWDALSGSAVRLTALLRAARTPQGLEQQAEFGALCAQLATVTGDLTPAQAAGWLRDLCGWLSVEVPAITALVNILESTQLHMLLEVHDDLSITRPAYLQDDLTLARLQQVLRQHLRPTMLRHGELLAPMEATIYHQPEPGAPMFVQVGEEVKVGQTLALLEAMKMFTELPSPVDGVVLAILVDNGQGVKTGTPLFRIATREAAEHAADDLLPQILERGFGNRFRLLMLEGDEGQP
jgi:biotin carboxyl carrier protein